MSIENGRELLPILKLVRRCIHQLDEEKEQSVLMCGFEVSLYIVRWSGNERLPNLRKIADFDSPSVGPSARGSESRLTPGHTRFPKRANGAGLLRGKYRERPLRIKIASHDDFRCKKLGE